jgi:ribose transport system permease protein
VVTLGLIIPLTANDFDLSIAFVMTMSSMLVAVLNVNYEIGVGWAVIAALALGIAVDLINGLLITVFRIHSLIVTLGTGTFLLGATLWLSESDDDQRNFALSHECGHRRSLFGVPLEFYYAIALAAVVWYLLEYTAVNRRILFVGRGREVARLSGINTDRIRVACLAASALGLATSTQGLRARRTRYRGNYRSRLFGFQLVHPRCSMAAPW